MTTDDPLQRLLQSALPPLESMVPGDAWPRIADRLDARQAWTRVDVALAAGIVIALLLVPDAILVLALHF